MEISLSTQILLFRDLDQWNKAKEILAFSENKNRFFLTKILLDNGCTSVVKVIRSLSDLEFYTLVFEYLDEEIT